MEYRGINLADSVNLYKKDGKFNKQVKSGLDNFSDLLMEKRHHVVSEYVGAKNKILIDFQCGHKPHWISPDKYKKGKGCPKCYGNCPEQAKEDLIRLTEDNGHLLLSEYIDAHDAVLIDFNCGHPPHMISPSSYKNGRGCPKCSGKCPEQAKEELILQVERNGHEILSEYINANTKVLIDFHCSHEPHWIDPNAYKYGVGCPRCSGSCPKQALEVLISLIELNGHTWVDGEYVDTKTKIKIDFKCPHEPHWIQPYNYKNGRGCPVCSESKGEKRVRKWLEYNKFEFESQKEFSGLIGTGDGLLSYDFYIPELNILIEYQGEFHDGSSGEYSKVNLASQQEHDKRKKEYATLHNINLLEIWYWDFDRIEEILENELLFVNH